VVRSQTVTEDINNTSEARATGGVVGVSANVPEKSQNGAEGARPISSSEQNRKNRSTAYEINRTTTNITRNPGSVKSVTAAVFIAPRLVMPTPVAGADPKAAPAAPEVQKRTPEELTALRQIVVNALGLKAAAGQSVDSLVSLQEISFQSAEHPPAQIEAVQKEERIQGWIEIARPWITIKNTVLVLLVFLRMLSKQRPEPVPIEVLSLSSTSKNNSLANAQSVTPELLNELIRQKPGNIGVALRNWVAEPASKN